VVNSLKRGFAFLIVSLVLYACALPGDNANTAATAASVALPLPGSPRANPGAAALATTPVPPPTAITLPVQTAQTANPATGPGSPASTAMASRPALPATQPPTATLPPSSTPDPYSGLSIAELAARDYGGGLVEIVEELERNDRFTRYLIVYPSDGLDIYGFINVPNDGYGFPIAIVLHGYVPPAEYSTEAYTTRYADALAEAGYFVFHPNLRNYPPSDSGEDLYRTGMAVDVLNLIAIIREQSQDPLGTLRRADADNIHLWGHSMGGGVALRAATVNNEPYVRGVVLYGAMSGDEQKNYEQIAIWTDQRAGDFELSAPPETLRAISPIYHLDRLRAPVSIHHSDADPVVPAAWSDELCALLTEQEHPVECFVYEGAPHTFLPPWDDVFMARFIEFFNRH
jgi:dienelactone hydrolase